VAYRTGILQVKAAILRWITWMVWTQQIVGGRPRRCEAMTGLNAEQVAELTSVVFALVGGV
jgi:hypothetical protein